LAAKSKKPSRKPAPKKPAPRRVARSKAPAAQKRAAKGRPAKQANRTPAAAPSAPLERVGLIELAGKPATVIGADVRVGDAAPEFTAQANDWSEVRPIESTTGKVRILLSLPSLSTDVCDRETRRFNEAAAELGEDVVVIGVSADLPPTQRNWCAAHGVARVQAVSDHMQMEFGLKYGAWIKERRWLRRAVFVLDRNDRVAYAAYMPAIGIEPNYDEVLAAARAAL
jgi:thiol peroxidase